MLKMAVVGDCSQGDPALFTKALDGALGVADVVVLVGDINSSDHTSYDVVTARLAAGKQILSVPGNHDYDYPAGTTFFASHPKQWRKDFPEAVLIGLDNGQDNFGPGWDILTDYAKNPPGLPLFLFMHKALSPLILATGVESTHIMGEGGLSPEAEKLKAWIRTQQDGGWNVTSAHGHYHGSSFMQTSHGAVILEGRGGSQGYAGAAVCGYTLIYVQADGWTAHPVDLT
jgi:hypothetical protein